MRYEGSQPEVLDLIRETGIFPRRKYYNWVVLYLKTGEILYDHIKSASHTELVLRGRKVPLDAIGKISIRGGHRSAKHLCAFWKHITKKLRQRPQRKKTPDEPTELPVVSFIRRKGKILNEKTEMVPVRALRRRQEIADSGNAENPGQEQGHEVGKNLQGN